VCETARLERMSNGGRKRERERAGEEERQRKRRRRNKVERERARARARARARERERHTHNTTGIKSVWESPALGHHTTQPRALLRALLPLCT